MANIFLEPTDSTFEVTSNNAKVFGLEGSQIVTVKAGTTGVVVDGNVEGLSFSGASTDYKFKQAGGNLEVYAADGVTLLAKTTGGVNATSAMKFSDGTASAKLEGAVLTLGGTKVTDTVAAVTPAVLTGGAPVPTFSVTTAPTVAEGATASFVVSLSTRDAGVAYSVTTTLAATGGAVAGTDFASALTLDAASTAAGITFANGVLTIPATATLTTATLTTAVTPDVSSPEAGEGLTLLLAAATGGAGTRAAQVSTTASNASATITDVPVTYTLTSSAASVYEGAEIIYTLTASAAATTDTSVDFSVTPGLATAVDQGTTTTNLNDFAAGAFNPTTVVIPANTKTATYKVTSSTDALTELPENYSVKAVIAGTTVATKETSLLDGGGTGVGTIGVQLSLTAGTDNIGPLQTVAASKSTSGNDTISATGATFTALDAIDGGDGTDTLAISDAVGVMNTAAPAVTVTNVENVNISTAGALGRAGVGAVAETAAVKQVTTITPTVVTGASVNTINVTYGAVTLTTAAMDGSPTAAEVSTLVTGAINAIAGTTVATTVGNQVVVTAPVAGTALPAIATVVNTAAGDVTWVQATPQANVVYAPAVTAVTAAPYDVSGFTGLTTLSVNKVTGDANLKVANTTDVTVSNADAAVAITGGKTVTVNKTMDVAADSIAVNGAAAVTINATNSAAAAGGIVLGGTTPVTGAVTINSTGAKIVGGTGAVALDTINVTGGTTVSITQAATADMGDVATKGTATDVVTQGAVTVLGGPATTSVSVVQGDQVTKVAAVTAVTGVSATKTITFLPMLANETVTIDDDGAGADSFVFTASKTLTANEVAAAFVGLTATEIQGQGYSSNGFYTHTGVGLANWNTGTANGAVVTFSEKVANSAAVLTVADTIASGNVAAPVAGVTGVTAVTGVTGVLGVANGAVIIDDAAATKTITSVTVDGYSADAVIGGTNNMNALTTLSLANSGGGDATITSTAATLALTVNDINTSGAAVSAVTFLNAALKTLNITSATKASSFELVAASVTALNVSGTQFVDVNKAGSALDALTTVVVSGSAGLALDAGDTDLVTSITTTATTGSVTATIDSTVATYTGGAGVDNVTLSNTTAATKAIALGGGNDTLTLAAGTAATPTITFDGGADSDTLAIASADAAAAATAFTAKFTGFEKLSLGANVAAIKTVDLATWNNMNYVLVTGNTFALTLDKVANNSTVELTGNNASATVTLTDATGTADILNLVTLNAATGTITAAGVETINVSATANNALTNNAVNVTISDAAVKTINVTGTGALTMVNTDNVALTSLDASTNFTGTLTATTNGTVAQAIKGGSGNDVLTAKAAGTVADTLLGGAGDDVLKSNKGLTVMTGGAGVDQFWIDAASLNVNSYATITDASKGDIIDFAGTVGAFAASKVTLGATAVFQDYANASTTGNATNALSWFQFGGDTYIIKDVDASTSGFVNGADMIVKLTGAVDLSIASYSQTNGTIELG